MLSLLSANERLDYDRFKTQEKQIKKTENGRIDAQKENWEAEEHFKRQPGSPALFDTHKDHQIRVRNTVTARILKTKEDIRQKFERRDIEYLERITKDRGQRKSLNPPLPEADRQKLKEAYRRAADRRRTPGNDRRRDRGDR